MDPLRIMFYNKLSATLGDSKTKAPGHDRLLLSENQRKRLFGAVWGVGSNRNLILRVKINRLFKSIALGFLRWLDLLR